MGSYEFLKKVVLWIFLNIIIVAFMDIALFSQITIGQEDTSIWSKLLTSEFWATIEWLFIVPAMRLGATFLNPAQLGLSSYAFNFIGQIITNNFWLKVPTTIDDYCGMGLIFVGMIISKMRLFG
jgi:uncharacterized protein (DUF486 family)